MKLPDHESNWNVFTCGIPNSHQKRTGSKFHIWNVGVWNMTFKCEVEDSRLKTNLTCEVFISQMELKQFTYKILFSYVKLQVKFSHQPCWLTRCLQSCLCTIKCRVGAGLIHMVRLSQAIVYPDLYHSLTRVFRVHCYIIIRNLRRNCTLNPFLVGRLPLRNKIAYR